MKILLPTALTLMLCVTLHANNSGEEVGEMKRMAEEMRRCAEEDKGAKLDECDSEAPAPVRAAASKVVASRNKVGAIEELLASAYEAGDKKRIQQLQKEKSDAELESEFAGKGKRVAYVSNSIDELVRDVPESSDAKQLKEKTEANLKNYLEASQKLMELQKSQMELETELEAIDSRIEIIRKREELKKLEQDAAEGK